MPELTIEPGTISHGTLRPWDLLNTFYNTLTNYEEGREQLAQNPMLDVRCCSLFNRMSEQDENDASGEPETDEDLTECSELVSELEDLLCKIAPEGHYFGGHWGDGSDFGFWPDEDYDEGEFSVTAMV